MMDGSNDQTAPNVNANSIKITDVTQDGDTLTFAITSQKLNSSKGICVFRTYEDFDWLQQSLFAQDDVAGLHGVIFPPLPAKPLPSSSHTQAKALKQLGFLALGDNWQLYCRALEFYLQQVAAHSILGKSKLLHSFLSSTESAGKQRSKKGIFDRLSQAMEEMRKEGHKDVDEFFHNERESNTHLTALFKATTEKFLEVVLTKQRLALACGHFSTSLHLCVNQDNPSAVVFSKICLKLSDIMDAVKRNLDKVSENDVCTLGLGLDLESRYQEAKREMLFRRTCKLVELEIISKNAEKAKPNKKEVMDKVQKITQKEFDLISSVAKEEIDWYLKARVSVLRDFLIHWCEKQLDTARESAALFSQHLEAWKGFPV
ncbi:sorting nexin-5 [Pangasianodon hypophthalmus]|uniref:sorting nexin-5 n=1 Tax=Pangasianodon hypophthalmus TaxID=310915 RepID=UPI000F00888A|nr:sorting nexin-5 [Pangasianodon hypophthalmus]